MAHAIQSPIHSDSLADVLERVLDKGVVIAGDVVVSLVGIELLSIKLRLLITTVDKATEMGIDWWRFDPQLSSAAAGAEGGVPLATPPMAPIDALGASPVDQSPLDQPSLDRATLEQAALGDARAPRRGAPEPIAAAPPDGSAPADRRDMERELRGRIAMLEKRIADLGG